MLFWTYVAIAAYLAVVVFFEMFSERSWKKQIAYAMILIPFILRVLQIK